MTAEVPLGPRLAKRVLLIGWDAADWKMIHPLLDAGLLPNLARFIDDGVIGNLATLQPMLSPMLWNSIATGKRPHKHGIHGFMEVLPDGSGIRPVSSHARRAKALWNILTQAGLRSHVFGWFASHPAEAINGVCVSNLFSHAPEDWKSPAWPLPPGAVHPARLEEILGELRVHPTEITGAHLAPFFPRGEEIDQRDEANAKGLNLAAKLLAECAGTHAAATWAMEHEPWDFCAVYYDAIDHFGHVFMPFHPPYMPRYAEKYFHYYRDVMNGVYRFHDLMLGRLLELAGDETTVIIASDHGFHSDHLRPFDSPEHPTGPVVWHRPFGVLAMRGPGLRRDERIYGASILDLAPTVLTLFGLPTGEDMDGQVLAGAFEAPPAVGRIPSWEDVPGETGMTPAAPNDPEATRQALQQLVDLGYIDPLDVDVDKQIRVVSAESRYNLARALMDAGLNAEALPPLESLVAESNDRRYQFTLSQAYLQLGRFADARRLIESMLASPPEKVGADGKLVPPEAPYAELLLGMLCLAEGREAEALEALRKAETADPYLPRLHIELGQIYLRQRRWEEAQRSFTRALGIDGDSAEANHGLATALTRLGSYPEAAELALRAVGLRHFYPAAHFQLGLILARLGWPERAVQALETGLTMRPDAQHIRRYLVRLYTRLGQSAKAASHGTALAATA